MATATNLSAYSLTAADIARRVRAGELAPRAIAEFYAERTKALGPRLNSHLHFDPADLLRQADELTQRLASSDGDLPLAGVPVVVKDNICVRGMPTTCGSKILEGYRPPYDAHVVERLRTAGALIAGKANCDEFGMGSSNENSAYGPVRNPWDERRVPGGSSGGTAAALAADLAPLGLGSDTGGSVRLPASFCGLVGLKPSYGRVSRYGLVAYGSSLDQVGPMARSVRDAALLLDAVSGHDPRDSTCAKLPATRAGQALASCRPEDAKALTIGVVRELAGDGLDAATRAAVEAAVKQFTALGARIVPISLPNLRYSIAAYYVIAPAEASANLARYDGVRYGRRVEPRGASLKALYRRTRSEGFGREVKQRVMLGTFALSSGYYDAYYGKAERARQLIKTGFGEAFTGCDLLLAATAPTPAFRLGERTDDPVAMYLSDVCTLGASLAGIPAVSLPCAFDPAGLPIGLQLMAKPFAEETLLKGAYLYEQAAGLDRHPSI